MAYYFLTASKDASIYLQQPNQNTGLDEILEISKVYYGNIKDVSRALLKFEVGFLSSSLVNNTIKLEDATLILKQTKSEELPLEYELYAYPISQSWQMGTGTRFDNVSTKGVTWNYREGDTKLDWLQNGLANGSDSNPNNGQGATWFTSVSASQNFEYQSADIEINVKSLLKSWMSGSISNDGVIIKFDDTLENDTEDYGQLKFFSKETNTIYQPKIKIGWDDQSFITGSLTQLTASDVKVGITNLKKEYKAETTATIRIFARELYPLKTFTNTFGYADIKYLPQTSYYQIKDFASNDIIIPFSDYSKLNCDSNGNYINLNLSNWEAGRVYKIEFKIDNNGDVQYFDDELTFNVVKD
ncbi:MAG: Disaggregatase related repeat [Pseudomonadota bacterium]|jgi:hypothetical protein